MFHLQELEQRFLTDIATNETNAEHEHIINYVGPDKKRKNQIRYTQENIAHKSHNSITTYHYKTCYEHPAIKNIYAGCDTDTLINLLSQIVVLKQKQCKKVFTLTKPSEKKTLFK